MAQIAKPIAVTRTYVPTDPNAFPQNLKLTGGEDSPEDPHPILAYEGYNFLPTSYGYKSYFGLNSLLNIDAIESNIDYVLLLQKKTLENFAVALADDGIWTKDTSATGAWSQAIVLVPVTTGHREWTYCVLGEDFYCYQQAGAKLYRISPYGSTPYEIEELVPNTLNMAGQLGIFRAGQRLGFWDSENSLGHSALDDKTDFVVSLQTMANTGQKFDSVIGKIVTVKQSGDGFIIYATKSIVFVERTITDAFMWRSHVVTDKAGVAYPREVTLGEVDTEHLAWTSMGLMQITGKEFEILTPDVTDFLRENKSPIYLDLLQNRYLFLNMLDNDYIDGKVSFTRVDIEPEIYEFRDALDMVEAVEENSCRAYTQYTANPPHVWVVHANDEDFEDLEKSPNGFPTNTDIPVFEGAYIRHLPEILIQQGISNSVVSAEGAGSDIEIIWNNASIITPKPLGVIDLNPIGLTVVDWSHRTGSSTEEQLTPINTFEDALQDWYGETRYITEYLKNSFSTYSETQVFEEVALEQAVYDAYIANEPLVNDETPNNTTGSSFTDHMTYLGMVPVEYYPPELVTNANYDYALLVQHVKRFAILYVKPFVNISNVESYELPPFNPIVYDLTLTFKFVSRVAYVDAPINPTATLTSEDTFGQFYLDSLPADRLKTKLYKVAKIFIDRFVQYDIDGNESASGTAAPSSPNLTDDHSTVGDTTEETGPIIFGISFSGFDTITGTVCFNKPTTQGSLWTTLDPLVIPPSSYLLQEGSPAPFYPTFVGALVYDLHLKKWGKMKNDYKLLFDYSPINNISSGIVPYDVFGVEGAVLLPNGKIANLDETPTDSKIKYGKIGYWRAGYTDAEEIKAHFRKGSTGTLGVVASLDGRAEEGFLSSEVSFTNAAEVVHYPGISARWYSIVITGQWDLQYLEFKGHRKGRR